MPTDQLRTALNAGTVHATTCCMDEKRMLTNYFKLKSLRRLRLIIAVEIAADFYAAAPECSNIQRQLESQMEINGYACHLPYKASQKGLPPFRFGAARTSIGDGISIIMERLP